MMRNHIATTPALKDSLSRLKRWQHVRLASTHADLLADPATARAARFFLDDLYGDYDLTDRDHAVERVIPKAAKVLPKAAMEVVADAIELDYLAERLDQEMAKSLLEAGVDRDGLLTEALYCEHFATATTLEDRLRQLELLEDIGRALSRLVKVPMMSWVLKVIAKPARAAGLGALHTFVVSGFDAFASLEDPAQFLQIIDLRERALIEQIFKGHRSPYQLGG